MMLASSRLGLGAAHSSPAHGGRALSNLAAGPGPSSTRSAIAPVLDRQARGGRRAPRGLHVAVAAVEPVQTEEIVPDGGTSSGMYMDVASQSEVVASRLGLPSDRVQRVLMRHPAALNLPAMQLTQGIEGLIAKVPLDRLSALAMYSKKPSLLQLEPEDILGRMAAVAAVAGLSPEEAAPLIAKQPSLLEVPPESLRSAVERAAASLAVTPQGLLLMLSRLSTPGLRELLALPPQQLADQAADLRALLASKFGTERAADAMMMVSRWPALLLADPKDVSASLDRVASILRLPPRRLMETVLRCPSLLCIPASQLAANYKGALAALRIDAVAVADMAAAEPRLLQLDAATFRARVEGMQARLFLPRKQVLDMVVRQPHLLLYLTPTLGAHLAALRDALRVPHAVAGAMVQAFPHLLLWSPAALQAKLTTLQRGFNLPPLRVSELVSCHPKLLTYSVTRLLASREQLVQGLGMEEGALQDVVRHCPQLLLEAPATVRGRASDLAVFMSVDESAVGPMLQRSPRLLIHDSRFWQTNFDSLTSKLGLRVPVARAAMRTCPKLLVKPPQALLAQCEALGSLLVRSPRWQQELEEAGAQGAVRLVTSYGSPQQEHMAFLVDQGLHGQQGLFEAPMQDRAAFLKAYPGFAAWQGRSRRQAAAGGVAGGGRRQRGAAAGRRRGADSSSGSSDGSSEGSSGQGGSSTAELLAWGEQEGLFGDEGSAASGSEGEGGKPASSSTSKAQPVKRKRKRGPRAPGEQAAEVGEDGSLEGAAASGEGKS